MKKLFKGLLIVLATLALTISVSSSEITETPDLLPENNTEITEHMGENREPDCNPNCDLPIIDVLEEDY